MSKISITDFSAEEMDIVIMFMGENRIETFVNIIAATHFMNPDIAVIAAGTAEKLLDLEEKKFSEIPFMLTDNSEGVDYY